MGTTSTAEQTGVKVELQESRVREAIARATAQQSPGPFAPGDPSALAAKAGIQRRYSDKIEALLLDPREGQELERVRNLCQAEMREAVQQEKAAVIRRSQAAGELRRSQMNSWRHSQELLATRTPLSPNLNFNFVILDTPALILPSQDLNLVQVAPAPWNNVAKVTGNWSSPYPDNGTDTLSFVFAWRNPAEHEALINIGSYLMLNAFCHAGAGPGWTHSDLFVSTRLSIYEWWNNPATNPPYQSGQINWDVPILEANGGGGFGIGEYKTMGISGNYDVEYRLFTVPAKEVAVFTVDLALGHFIIGDGYLDVDFASGGFEVMCPAVVLGILK